jgi:hypothetical protein
MTAMTAKKAKVTDEADEESQSKIHALVRIGRLDSIGAVASELGRLYRHARRGHIGSMEAYRLAAILNVLRQCLEAGEMERRLEGLERQAEAKGLPRLLEFPKARGA